VDSAFLLCASYRASNYIERVIVPARSSPLRDIELRSGWRVINGNFAERQRDTRTANIGLRVRREEIGAFAASNHSGVTIPLHQNGVLFIYSNFFRLL